MASDTDRRRRDKSSDINRKDKEYYKSSKDRSSRRDTSKDRSSKRDKSKDRSSRRDKSNDRRKRKYSKERKSEPNQLKKERNRKTSTSSESTSSSSSSDSEKSTRKNKKDDNRRRDDYDDNRRRKDDYDNNRRKDDYDDNRRRRDDYKNKKDDYDDDWRKGNYDKRKKDEEYDKRKNKEDGELDDNEENSELQQNQSKTKEQPKKKVVERRRPVVNMLATKTGGAYIPPGRLKLMQEELTDKNSEQFQRISWEALKKSINGLINKVNTSNVTIIVRELMKENLIRGRGLLIRSILTAQSFSTTYTNVYACLIAIINTKFPQIGELLLKRLVNQFKKSYKRNDKAQCLITSKFIAHLVNQQVAHEIIALEILTLLLENVTSDSVEVAVAFMKEVGCKLQKISPQGFMAIFESLRNIIQESQVDSRIQYMIEVLYEIRKTKFVSYPAIIEELDVINEEEQYTHLKTLDEDFDTEDALNVYKFDENYEENENKYKEIIKEILDEDSDSDDSDSDDEDSDDEEDEEGQEDEDGKGNKMEIIDNTETNLINLRREIYLTIQSSLSFEEAAHKILKLELKSSQLETIADMILECCIQQRTYLKFYGLLGQRFCELNNEVVKHFENLFKTRYNTIQRYETIKLRNIGKFFAHLLFTDSISWTVLDCIILSEEETCSASRVYIKVLMQELSEYMGIKKLNERFHDETLIESFKGLFPKDNPQNTRFAINYFTSIQLGPLTDDMRKHLNME